MSNGARGDEAGVRNGGVPAGGGPLGKELLQRELLAVCVGDERDRAQAAAAAGGLAGKEDRVPTAQLRPCSGVVRQIRRLEAAHADEAGAGRPPCSVTEPPRLPGLIFKASGDGRTKAGKSKVIQFLLLMLCALGGSIGGFLAMAVTGTKQGIDYFKLRVPLLIIPNAVCLVLLGVA